MTFLGLQWAMPLVFLLLPLALLPWITHNQDKTVAWSRFVPQDKLSDVIGMALKVFASIAITSLILSLAGPYIPEQKVERVGQGAEVVILVDRSRSMDNAFALSKQPQSIMQTVGRIDSKRRIAKKYLLKFLDKRPDDRFGFVLFSDQAIDLLPLTYSKEAIRATINASALGKGLSETNIANALIKAAEMYKDQTYRGSRIALLVSDGGQEFSPEVQREIAELYKREQLTLYWIYMRSLAGLTLEETEKDTNLFVDRPERKLHTFFKSLEIPYRAFEVESLKSFSKAMDEIDKQEYQTLIVEDTVPREGMSAPFFYIALLMALLLAMAQLYTFWGVKKAHE